MNRMLLSIKVRAAIAAVSLIAVPLTAHGQILTKAFQNGLNGYTGTFDRLISSTPAQDNNGSNVAAYFLDGYDLAGSADAQNLIRFDNIVGGGAGQIPANATILSAKLSVTTSQAGSAQTSGPYGVAALLGPFDGSTTHGSYTSSTNFGSRGPWWQDGSATRPVGGYGFTIPGRTGSASVTPLVQSWASGAPNYGFVMEAGLSDSNTVLANTADGWSIQTTGFPISDIRPKLEVTYTTAAVQVNSFQRGANGYNGDTMAIVRSGLNALNPDPAATPPEVTEDASTLDQTFLDGVFFTNTAGDTSSPDDLALLKFGNVFGTNPGQAPTNVPVAKAWAVITTGDASNNANTPGPFTAHTMLRTWETTSLHSSFGAVNGLQIGDGDISPALDTQEGMIRGSEVWFDVTSYLEGVRNGAADNGIAILTTGTADGWQINANGAANAAARPRLLVYSADLGIVNPLEGDFDSNGKVDMADYVFWRNNNGTQEAYNLWRSHFGQTRGGGIGAVALGGSSSAPAVPEPCTIAICGLASLGLIGRRKQRS